MYRSAGQLNCGRNASTAACEHPESNQTSRMSSVFSKFFEPHLPQEWSGGVKSPAGRAYQTSEPSAAKISSTRLSNAGVSATSLQLVQRKAGIGTPQARWRDR